MDHYNSSACKILHVDAYQFGIVSIETCPLAPVSTYTVTNAIDLIKNSKSSWPYL